MPRESKLAGIIAGLMLAVLGSLIAWNTSQMKIAPNYANVGPQAFPYVAAIALAAAGIFFIWQALVDGYEKLTADTSDTDWRALSLIAGGFIFEIVFIKPLGFILASTVLFWAVSFAFGSRRYLRDGLFALGLSAGAYLVFTKLLNLQLPAGVLKGLI